MKKRIMILLSAIICLLCCGCQKKAEELREPTAFYYCNRTVSFNTEEGVICSEMREGEHFSADAEKMLREYLSGPKSAELYSPIPQGTELVSFEINLDTAYIILSKEFSNLNGIKLSTACSCMVKTLAEYTPITKAQIYVDGGLIDNKDSITITVADIVLVDSVEQKG